MNNPTFYFYATLTVFVILCAIFILLIMIQKGRGGGISSAFGGAGGNTAFGSKTGDVLTWATSVVFLLFLVMCVALNFLARQTNTFFTENQTRVGAPAAQPGNAAIPSTDLDKPTPTPTKPDTTALPDVETPATPATQPGTN